MIEEKRKKILIIHHAGSFGGGALSLFHILKALNENQECYEFQVYCPSDPPYFYEFLSEHFDNIVPAKNTLPIFNHYNGGSRFIFSPQSLFNIFKIIKRKGVKELLEVIRNYQPNIIAINTMTLAWLGPILKKDCDKLICFNRESYAKGTLGLRTKFLKWSLCKYFSGIAFISKYDMHETGENIECKTQVITDKVEKEVYETTSNNKVLSSDNYNILFLGGMSRLKGAHVAVEALNYLKREKVKLIFVQYNPRRNKKQLSECKTLQSKLKFVLGLDYEKRVLKFIDKNDLWDKIEFIPSVASPESYIMDSDLIIFPSTKGHQARPIYEAGIAKVPIIITEFGNTAEFAENNINCITIPSGNSKILSEKIMTVKTDEELVEKIVNQNYKNSVVNHNFALLNKELKTFFDSI